MAIKVVVLDLDGVLYRGNTLIPGANRAVDTIRKMGLRVVFLTNAGTHSRSMRAGVLRKLGIAAKPAEVYTSSYAAGKYIAEKYGKVSVFYVGEKGTGKELRNAGLRVINNKKNTKSKVVVVCLDQKVTYDKLARASVDIMKGAAFIATNCDSTFPVERGLLMPGAGALVKFVEFTTGVNAFVVGKPNTYMLKMVMKEAHVKPNEVIIVGDRLDSDIEVGKRAGIKTALVLTGVTKKQDLKKLGKKEMPDYVLRSIRELPGAL
jgi:HAD superfamily hydrolase (TIGR01457 family)